MSDALRVVFVCVENSCRSQIAEGFARREAAKLSARGGPRVDAFSAGSRPSGVVNPKAIASMAEVGIDISRHESKGLGDLPDDEFEFAVTMGCGDACPMLKARRRVDLFIPDPKAMPPEQFRVVRDQIAGEVEKIFLRL